MFEYLINGTGVSDNHIFQLYINFTADSTIPRSTFFISNVTILLNNKCSLSGKIDLG